VTPTQNVAVKCISKKQKSSKLISAEEINILKEVTHDNIVQLYDFKETDKSLIMVMEFCNGGDLAEYLRDKGTLSELTLSLFVRQLGDAMLAIHKMGVMHRDLKPGNILLTHSSSLSLIQPRDIKLKIADFGFARFLNDEDMAATLCGSPIYMAPEVLMGLQYDGRVDLWSLGTIIYQCLTGKAPFKANNPYSLRNFYEKSPELVPAIPKQTSPSLTDLILSLLQKDPSKRLTFEDLVKHRFLDSGQRSNVIPVSRRSPRASPSSSPSHPTSRSPNSISSNKLASMQRMRRNTTPPRPAVEIPIRTPHAVPGVSEDVFGSPDVDSEGFILVNTQTKTTPSKLKSIESSFMQKSQAISSSVKTTAMATPIKHTYSQEHLADISPSPRSRQSPIAQKLEEDKILETPHYNMRDAPRRLSSGSRNISAPNFFQKRTMSVDGHKRHRSTSESTRNSTPPRMELVSRSVRQSPTRRPFSTNFEDSFYQPRPLSASRVSSGQSAPAYFFLGGSPYNSPPSLRENSPLQLTMGETSPPFSQPFETPPELSETTIMDEHQREMLDDFQATLQYTQAIREAANLLDKPFSPTDFKDKIKLQQKLILCEKSETMLSANIHQAKQQLFAKTISPSKTFKETLYSIYGEFCAVHTMKCCLEKEISALPPNTEENPHCPEEILLSFAFEQIRSGILDETYGHVGECVKRYRLSLAIILGLLSEVKSENDRHILLKYENGLQIRIENLHGRRRLPNST